MRFPVIVLFVSVTALAHAQSDEVISALTASPTINVTTQQVEFRKEVAPALVMNIVADEDSYTKDWKAYVGSHYGVEFKKVMGWMEATQVVIPAWLNDTLSVYYSVDKDGDFIRLSLLASHHGQFLNSTDNASAVTAMENDMKSQAKEFYIKYYDKIVALQQKEYDRQLKDQAKLVAAATRLIKNKESAEGAIRKSESSISSLKNNISSSENKSKTLEEKGKSQRDELDRTKKELEMTNSQIVSKQKEYDQLNAKGDLDTKQAERVMKDLEKMRSSQAKQQDKVTSLNKTISKTESSIIDSKNEKNKLESKIRDQENLIDKSKDNVKDAEKDIERNKVEQATKATLVEAAKEKLERLKTAKAGVMAK